MQHHGQPLTRRLNVLLLHGLPSLVLGPYLMVPGHRVRARAIEFRPADMVDAVHEAAETSTIRRHFYKAGGGHVLVNCAEGFGVVQGDFGSQDSG